LSTQASAIDSIVLPVRRNLSREGVTCFNFKSNENSHQLDTSGSFVRHRMIDIEVIIDIVYFVFVSELLLCLDMQNFIFMLLKTFPESIQSRIFIDFFEVILFS
jgi:hypothetical protein